MHRIAHTLCRTAFSRLTGKPHEDLTRTRRLGRGRGDGPGPSGSIRRRLTTASPAVARWATEAAQWATAAARWATPAARVSGSADTAGGLPSTGSSALDTAIAGAGLLLLVGGGAVVVASRRKELEPPDALQDPRRFACGGLACSGLLLLKGPGTAAPRLPPPPCGPARDLPVQGQ